MEITAKKFRELLVEPGYISEVQFAAAAREAAEEGKDLEDVLVDKELIKDGQLGWLIAQDMNFQFADLSSKESIDEDILNLIPEIVARSKGVIAFGSNERGVKLGMRDPGDLETMHLVEKRVGKKATPYFITKRDFQKALSRYEAGLEEEIGRVFERLNSPSLTREEKDEATVRIVDILFFYGYSNNASDIHIEPYIDKILIRFRIDGIMHDVLEMPKELADLILTRIKILSKIRTDEHRAAQDGKLRLYIDQERHQVSVQRRSSGRFEILDVRVSIVPVVEGENVVMRLLSARSRRFSLIDLGLGGRDLEKVKNAIKSSHGMILVTGPTGSGKTTTLYAVMKILNKREVHIATIEDPVEYDIEGISQIQVNTRTNLTFAKGLRAIVRQDPDIIMVGEIRDEETAGIAVNSALTGHLVLSTLHTNDSTTTLPRLLDMKIEPFLVASTVNIAIAQRLVRKICEKCRVSYLLTDDEKKLIEEDPRIKNIFKKKGYENLDKVMLYKGNGCRACGDTGYIGRIGIFEVLEMSDDIKDLILKRASSSELMKTAVKNGMKTMLDDGLKKVFIGTTTLEEVVRVTRE